MICMDIFMLYSTFWSPTRADCDNYHELIFVPFLLVVRFSFLFLTGLLDLFSLFFIFAALIFTITVSYRTEPKNHY